MSEPAQLLMAADAERERLLRVTIGGGAGAGGVGPSTVNQVLIGGGAGGGGGVALEPNKATAEVPA